MAKGYWIAHVEVRDLDAYQAYIQGARASFERHGARFLVRGGAAETMEGEPVGSRHVVIEFPSFAEAKACWASEGYQAAREHRLPVSAARITIVEGAD